mmetsp:Transcript_36769/g.80704  ORF Transcript_36769/g.80704 Transcript_36769/m.80704 type:complete len:185 (+) Transcript_36769:3-557(+)
MWKEPPASGDQRLYLSTRLAYDQALPRTATATLHAAARKQLGSAPSTSAHALFCWYKATVWRPSEESYVGSINADNSKKTCVHSGMTLLTTNKMQPSVYARGIIVEKKSDGLPIALQAAISTPSGPLRALPHQRKGPKIARFLPSAATPVVTMRSALQARYGIGMSALQRANEAALLVDSWAMR